MAAIAVKAILMALLLKLSIATNHNSKIQTKADILFIIDHSGSIGYDETSALKTALYSVVQMLPIGEDTVNVGIITYRCAISIPLQLSHGTSKKIVNETIYGLPDAGNGMDLAGAAMDLAINTFKDEARNDSVRILVMISDGCTFRCLPGRLAPCFGSYDISDWNVKQCRTKGRQCARPNYYHCATRGDTSFYTHCGFNASSNVIVYDQAETLKAQYGVHLVTVATSAPESYCAVNMKCWANDGLSFSVGNYYELAKRLKGIIQHVISKKPPKDCRYIENQGVQCRTNVSGKGTMYECSKEVTLIIVSQAESGGTPCPTSPIIRICNLEDCYSNVTNGSVVYYAIKLVVVKRKPPKGSSLRFFVLGALIVTLIGTVVGIVVLAVILLKKTRRRGKSTGIQMTQRESPAQKGRNKTAAVTQSGPKSAGP